MSRHHLNSKRLKFFGNIVFIAIAIALFILSTIEYARSYVKRDNYNITQELSGNYSIVKENTNTNVSIQNDICSFRFQYSQDNAQKIFRWFISSQTSENRAFHTFYWFFILFALMVSIVPPVAYINKYFTSNHYHITERSWFSTIIIIIRTFFSMMIFVLPNFYMNTFDFSAEPCLNAYPSTFAIDMLPLVFATFICLVVYYLFDLTVSVFYNKYPMCCSKEFVSYVGLCILSLIIVGVVFFSATIMTWVWIISFIEKRLQLTAILIIVQYPFLIVQAIVH